MRKPGEGMKGIGDMEGETDGLLISHAEPAPAGDRQERRLSSNLYDGHGRGLMG